MSTVFFNDQTAKRDWYIIDADGKTLGRLATEVARRLRGKHKPEFTPHVDTGDFIKSTTLGKMLAEHPERVIEKAVKGMLPKGPLGYAQFRKLKVYAGAEHPHTAQQPKTFTI